MVLPKAVTATTLHSAEASASARLWPQPTLAGSAWGGLVAGEDHQGSGPIPLGAELAYHRLLQTGATSSAESLGHAIQTLGTWALTSLAAFHVYKTKKPTGSAWLP